MIRTKTIKIWTLITHALIIIGLGHGILTLGIYELFTLVSFFTKTNLYESTDIAKRILFFSALCSLTGQATIFISLFTKSKPTELSLHLLGLLLLWSGLLSYVYGIRNDGYAHLAILTCLPFAYITARTLLGRHIQKLWTWIINV